MKVEEATDFDRALEVDRRTWEIVAKIQAREARRLLGCPGNSPAELARCLALKFATEGRVWCAEFGTEYRFEMAELACAGADHCELRFRRK